MPTTRKRRARQSNSRRFTPAVLDAFRAGDEMELARLLGLRPWQWPYLVPLDDPGPWPNEDWRIEGRKLHLALIEAAEK